MSKKDFQKVDKVKYKAKRKFIEMRKDGLKAIIASGKSPDSELAKKELDRRAEKRRKKSNKSKK